MGQSPFSQATGIQNGTQQHPALIAAPALTAARGDAVHSTGFGCSRPGGEVAAVLGGGSVELTEGGASDGAVASCTASSVEAVAGVWQVELRTDPMCWEAWDLQVGVDSYKWLHQFLLSSCGGSR